MSHIPLKPVKRQTQSAFCSVCPNTFLFIRSLFVLAVSRRKNCTHLFSLHFYFQVRLIQPFWVGKSSMELQFYSPITDDPTNSFITDNLICTNSHVIKRTLVKDSHSILPSNWILISDTSISSICTSVPLFRRNYYAGIITLVNNVILWQYQLKKKLNLCFYEVTKMLDNLRYI